MDKDKRDKFPWAIVILGFMIVFAIGGVILYNILSFSVEKPEPSPEQKEEVSTIAPDFTVYNDNGEAVKFSSLEGKPAVIYIFTTWNSQCRTELDYFENAWKKYGDKVDFMMINLTYGESETEEKVKSFVKENGYTFPVYYDKHLDVASFAYDVLDIPLTVLVNENDIIVKKYTDKITEEKLLENIVDLLGG